MAIREDYVCEGRGADGTLLLSLARSGEGMCVCVWGGGGEYCRMVDSSAKSGKRTGRPPAASSTHTPACQILT
jgi:hypothetical protein